MLLLIAALHCLHTLLYILKHGVVVLRLPPPRSPPTPVLHVCAEVHVLFGIGNTNAGGGVIPPPSPLLRLLRRIFRLAYDSATLFLHKPNA